MKLLTPRRVRRISAAEAFRTDGLWYLATPYSKYPGGTDLAFKHALRIAAHFIDAGVPIFSPIAHSHPISEHTEADALDHHVWLGQDEVFMGLCCGMIAVEMTGWMDSYGMEHECQFFRAIRKPVYRFDPSAVLTERVLECS